jgi:hypothetical protein
MPLHKQLAIEVPYFLVGVIIGLIFVCPMYQLTDVQILSALKNMVVLGQKLHPLVVPLLLVGFSLAHTGYVWKKWAAGKIKTEKLPLDKRRLYSLIAGATLTLAIAGGALVNWQFGVAWLFPGLAALYVIYLQTEIVLAINDSVTELADKNDGIPCRANCLMILGITAIGIGLQLIKTH